MNSSNFDESGKPSWPNRLTEFFRQIDEKSASGKTDPTANVEKGTNDDVTSSETDAATGQSTNERHPELDHRDVVIPNGEGRTSPEDFDSEDQGLVDSCDDENGENVKSPLRISMERMEEPDFRHAALVAQFRGDLQDFLSFYGMYNSFDIAKVESLLDRYYPTIYHRTDALYELMEQELARRCFDGCMRIGDYVDGVFCEVTDSHSKHMNALTLLLSVTQARLGLQPKLKDLDGTP